MAKSDEIAGKELQYNMLIDKGIDIENRVIRINSEIDDEVFSLVDSGMTIMEADNKKQITVRINSDGGEVYSALAIVGRLKRTKGIKIVTEGYGRIMSAATLILACGDRRRISNIAFFMHHEASYEIPDSTRLSEIQRDMKQWLREEELWAKKMEEFSNSDKDYWYNIGIGKDVYFDAEELLNLGVVDEIF